MGFGLVCLYFRLKSSLLVLELVAGTGGISKIYLPLA